MASYLPNQPLNINLETFSDAVKRLMEERGMTQADLVKRSGLSKYIISRIVRNTNDKGGSYTPTEIVVMQLGIGFRLTGAETKENLLYAAFPERAFWDDFLDNHLDIEQINDIYYENGLTLLGNVEE